ncbi:hypothetical protein OSTOST_05687 [Ostertagia ostertagi]
MLSRLSPTIHFLPLYLGTSNRNVLSSTLIVDCLLSDSFPQPLSQNSQGRRKAKGSVRRLIRLNKSCRNGLIFFISKASSNLTEAEFREYAELLHRSKHGELPLKELLHKLMELFGPWRKHLLTSKPLFVSILFLLVYANCNYTLS